MSNSGAPAPAPGPAPASSDKPGNNKSGSKPSASAGFGSDGEHLESLTLSGIGVSTAQDTAGILRPTFDAQRTQREMGAQVQITQTFSQKAPKAVAELSDWVVKDSMQQISEARQYLNLWREREEGRLTDPKGLQALAHLERSGEMTPERALTTLEDPELRARQALFVEGGAGRVALHTLTGALGGGLQGALGAGSVAAVAPQIDALQQRLVASAGEFTREHGLHEGYSHMLGQAAGQLASSALGAVVGGTTGSGFALAVDTNNRQLHWLERNIVERLAKEKAEESCRDSECVAKETTKWIDALERVAEGRVDDEERRNNELYYQTLTKTLNDPSSEGARGHVQSYFRMLEAAENLLKPYMGANIQYRGVTLTSHGAPQTYFSATAAQRADPYENYFLGVGRPGDIVFGRSDRDEARLINFSARNGSAQPIYPVEEFVLGLYGERLMAEVGRGLARIVGRDTVLGGAIERTGYGSASASGTPGRSKASTDDSLAGSSTNSRSPRAIERSTDSVSTDNNIGQGGTADHLASRVEFAGGVDDINGVGFSLDVRRYPYAPEGRVMQQSMLDSCVAAACRMRVSDAGVDVPEAYLRSDLGWLPEEGASFRNIPNALAIPENGGMTANFSRDTMRLRALRDAIELNGAAIANVNGHAVVVDGIEDGIVKIRDPLHGAYGVAVRDFLRAWVNNNRVVVTVVK